MATEKKHEELKRINSNLIISNRKYERQIENLQDLLLQKDCLINSVIAKSSIDRSRSESRESTNNNLKQQNEKLTNLIQDRDNTILTLKTQITNLLNYIGKIEHSTKQPAVEVCQTCAHMNCIDCSIYNNNLIQSTEEKINQLQSDMKEVKSRISNLESICR